MVLSLQLSDSRQKKVNRLLFLIGIGAELHFFTEAIEVANATTYGLACSVLTENLSRAFRVAHQLEAGLAFVRRLFSWSHTQLSYVHLHNLQVNCLLPPDVCMPMMGYKQSGIGVDHGQHALDTFVIYELSLSRSR